MVAHDLAHFRQFGRYGEARASHAPTEAHAPLVEALEEPLRPRSLESHSVPELQAWRSCTAG